MELHGLFHTTVRRRGCSNEVVEAYLKTFEESTNPLLAQCGKAFRVNRGCPTPGASAELWPLTATHVELSRELSDRGRSPSGQSLPRGSINTLSWLGRTTPAGS